MIHYRWECPRGHRFNAAALPSVCPACGRSRDEGGEWVDHGHRLRGADIEPTRGSTVDMAALWNSDGTPDYDRIEAEIAAGNIEVRRLASTP